jgi:hypothetical protein
MQLLIDYFGSHRISLVKVESLNMNALTNLYSKSSVGGYLIIDDCGMPEDECRPVISNYGMAQRITKAIADIHGCGAYRHRVS